MGVKNLLNLSEISIAENHAGVKSKLIADKSEVGAFWLVISLIFFLKFKNGGFHEGLNEFKLECFRLRFCP